MHPLDHLISILSTQMEGFIQATRYVGVVLLMAIESFNIPLPSEVILTFAGYLVQQSVLNIHGAALAGAVGCVIGSVPSYWIGYWGGRPFLARYGKWLLLTHHDLEVSERWVTRYGNIVFFICRMLPLVRTFISLPAGILRAPFWPFIFNTFIGSWIWSYALVWVGIKFGQNETMFKQYWHQFDGVIIGIVFILGILYVVKHVQHFRSVPESPLQND